MENEATTTIVGGGSGGGGGDKEGGEEKKEENYGKKSSPPTSAERLGYLSNHVYAQMIESWTQQAQHSTMKDPMCFTVHTVQWCGG